jgi:hypothetical protein
VVIAYLTDYYGEKSQDVLIGLALTSFGLGTAAVFFGALQMKISDQEFEYWSLEKGYRALNLSDIQHAQIRVGLGSRPGIRLEILPRDTAQKGISMALKDFRKVDVDRVFNWLGPKPGNPDKLDLTNK